MNAKVGEVASLQDFKTQLETQGLLKKTPPTGDTGNRIVPVPTPKTTPSQPAMADAEDFDAFLARNEDALRGVLYQEFLKQKREQALREVENFNFYTGKAVISGTAIGLPGTGNKVFNANNFDKILEGNNFIEPLSTQEKEKIVDMNITRVFKQPDGNARFLEITDTRIEEQNANSLADVIKFDPGLLAKIYFHTFQDRFY